MTSPARAWPTLLSKAEAARRAGDAGTALALARRAHDAAPDQPAPAFLFCLLLLDGRDPGATVALGRLDRFLFYGPGWDALGHTLLAHYPTAARVAFERAARAYEASEAASPDADVAHRLGVMLRHLGDAQGARAALERATARDPGLATAWFVLGLLRQDERDRSGAVQAFQAALAARADYHEAAFNLAVVLQEAGNMEAAMDHFARAWRLRPDSFGRIAQALVSAGVGRLWLDPTALQRELAARA